MNSVSCTALHGSNDSEGDDAICTVLFMFLSLCFSDLHTQSHSHQSAVDTFEEM